jgi:hypothetical protein
LGWSAQLLRLGRCRGLGRVGGGAAHFSFFLTDFSYILFSCNKIKTTGNQALNKSSKNNATA